MRVRMIPKEAIAAAEARLFTKTKSRDLGATRASVEAFDGQSRVELRQVFVLASILGVNVWRLLDDESKLAVWNAVPVFKTEDEADSVALFRAESLDALEAQLRNVSGAGWVSPESVSGAGIMSLPGALDHLPATELAAIQSRALFCNGESFDSKHAHWVISDDFSDQHIEKQASMFSRAESGVLACVGKGPPTRTGSLKTILHQASEGSITSDDLGCLRQGSYDILVAPVKRNWTVSTSDYVCMPELGDSVTTWEFTLQYERVTCFMVPYERAYGSNSGEDDGLIYAIHFNGSPTAEIDSGIPF